MISTLLCCGVLAYTGALLPWVDGQGYATDAYSWWVNNTGQPTMLYQNGVYTGAQEGAGGMNDLNMASAWAQQPTANIIVGLPDDSGTHHVRVQSLIESAAPGVTVLNYPTHYSVYDMVLGIDWCRTNGAKIVTLAWGTGPDESLSNAIRRCEADGVLVCCAVPNAAPMDYPSLWATQMRNILPVATTDKQGNLYVSEVPPNGISAPGRNVPVLDGTTIKYGSGSSYAVGIASGCIALIWSAKPELEAWQVNAFVQLTASGIHRQISPVDCLALVRLAQEQPAPPNETLE